MISLCYFCSNASRDRSINSSVTETSWSKPGALMLSDVKLFDVALTPVQTDATFNNEWQQHCWEMLRPFIGIRKLVSILLGPTNRNDWSAAAWRMTHSSSLNFPVMFRIFFVFYLLACLFVCFSFLAQNIQTILLLFTTDLIAELHARAWAEPIAK